MSIRPSTTWTEYRVKYIQRMPGSCAAVSSTEHYGPDIVNADLRAQNLAQGQYFTDVTLVATTIHRVRYIKTDGGTGAASSPAAG